MYQFLTNTHCFDAPSEYLIMKKILEGTPVFPDGFPLIAKDLITLVLKKNPEDRPSYKEIKAHPFFSGIDFSKIGEQVPPPLVPTEIEQELVEVVPADVLEPEEKLLFTTFVSKKKSLMVKSREFMITDCRLLLISPFKKEIKNMMDWKREITVVKRNECEFVVSNGKENWFLEDFKDSEKLIKKILEYKKVYQ